MSSSGDGFGIWMQAIWWLTEPLFPVTSGDTFQIRGWIDAPQNNGGVVSLSFDYLNGVYEDYDRQRLQADIQPLLDWATANNVLLFVGEFGAMTNSPGDSRYDLLADTISMMNETGLHCGPTAIRAVLACTNMIS